MFSDEREVGRRVGEFVEVGNGLNESCEIGSRGCKVSGGGEVIFGNEVEGYGCEFGERWVGFFKLSMVSVKFVEVGLGVSISDVGGFIVEG